MGKSLNNPMQTWYGKVGANVYSKLFGQQVIREYSKPSNPNTEKQRLVRARFVLMVRVQTVLHDTIALGMKAAAKSSKMFPNNRFMKANYKNVTGSAPDNVTIDPSKIVVAEGNLTGVVFGSNIENPQPGTLSVSVSDINAGIGNASADDKIYMVAYCPDAKASLLSAGVNRATGATLSVRYPDSWSGLEVHVYGFVVSPTTGKTSDSEYIGHAEIG